MSIKLNEAENRLISIVVWLVTFYGVIIATFNYFVSDPNYRALLSGAFLLISILLLFKGKEAIFGNLLLKIVSNKQFDTSLKGGVWHLQINFEDQTRTGTLRFKKSLIGMKVIGDRLFNNKTNEIERQGWYAEDAEIIKYHDKEILKYIYKISGKKNEDTIEKVGIVIASRELGTDDKPFDGIFKDISLEKNQVSREGSVTLYRTGS
jgi:hypothetical protein